MRGFRVKPVHIETRNRINIVKRTLIGGYVFAGLLFAAGFVRYSAADEVWPMPPATNSEGRRIGLFSFTTKAYHDEAFKLVLQEVNQVAKNMKLEDDLPLTPSNIVGSFISPYGFARAEHALGNITTHKFCYYVSEDDKFSYIEGTHQLADGHKYQASHTWPTNKINLDEAYQQATQWLAAASMDVPALNRDCKRHVAIDMNYSYAPAGKFVPVYWVVWGTDGKSMGPVASVRVFTPTKTLMQLRVNDSKYILRRPIVFTNLQTLISSP